MVIKYLLNKNGDKLFVNGRKICKFKTDNKNVDFQHNVVQETLPKNLMLPNLEKYYLKEIFVDINSKKLFFICLLLVLISVMEV